MKKENPQKAEPLNTLFGSPPTNCEKWVLSSDPFTEHPETFAGKLDVGYLTSIHSDLMLRGIASKQVLSHTSHCISLSPSLPRNKSSLLKKWTQELHVNFNCTN